MSNEILIKNKYYPSGLREKDIHKYYTEMKIPIFYETADRNVILLIATDENKFVVRRNLNNSPIKLSITNYEKIIHPRVVSIFVETPELGNIWCIDIDSGGSVSEKDLKECVKDVIKIFDKLYEKGYTLYKNYYRVTSTASGYHVFGYMNKNRTAEQNYELAEEYFSNLDKKYVFNKKKYSSSDIIIDLSPMRRRGSYQVPWALCKNGLICMDVTKNLDKFKRTQAIIK